VFIEVTRIESVMQILFSKR